MALRTTYFESVANGTTPTDALIQRYPSDPATIALAGTHGAEIRTTTRAAHGKNMLYMNCAASATVLLSDTPGGSSQNAAMSMFINVPAAPGSANQQIMQVRNGSATTAQLFLRTTGKLVCAQTSSGTFIGTDSPTLVANTTIRVDFKVLNGPTGTGDGTIEARYALSPFADPEAWVGGLTGTATTGTVAMTILRAGKLSGPGTLEMYLDTWRRDLGATDYIPRLYYPPSANLGFFSMV